MDTLIMVGQFLLSLSILIILHECGHFIPTRWFNIRVEKFYLFFDPWFSVLKYKIGETEYGLGWLPLGGYVKISGMIDESFDTEQMAQPVKPWEFRAKPAWQRLIVMLGGVTVNFILAVVVFAGILFYWGEQYLSTDKAENGIVAERLGVQMGLENGDKILSIGGSDMVKFDPLEATRRIIIDEARVITVERNGIKKDISIPEDVAQQLTKYENKGEVLYSIRLPITIAEVAEDMEAAKIGLQVGDELVAIDSTTTAYYDQFVAVRKQLYDKSATIRILRDGKTIDIQAQFDSIGRLGFFPYGANYYYDLERKKFTLSQSIVGGYERTVGFIGDQLKAFGQMFRGKIKASESLGSFISIGKMYGSTWDWRRFWGMTATLSALLGFVNLLPIPGLDGGHVMFLLWEVVSGRKPSDKVLEVSTMLGFFLLIGLMIYALGLDIMRQF